MIATEARERYDLVIMASELRGGLQRLGHADVTWEVIRDSGTPVLVVPAHVYVAAVRQPPRRVVVPLDGSETALMILSQIAPLARALHWMLILVGVVDAPQPTREQALAIHGYLTLVAGDLHRQLVPTRLVVRQGDPAPAILDLARAAGADFLALSTHSQRGLNPMRPGSVADYLITHSAMPVLAYHPGAAAFLEAPGSDAAGALSRRTLERISPDLPRPR
jgi:nucleotide-binding universal stress UspA family protein